MRFFLKSKKRVIESGVVYILGSGCCGDERYIPGGSDVFGVNYGSRRDCKYIGSLHARYMTEFIKLAPSATTFSRTMKPCVDYVVNVKPLQIGSGMYCAAVACLLGYEDVRLCNIPLDNVVGGSYTEQYYDRFNVKVREIPDCFKEKIRSYSGWTKEYFGGVK